MNCPNCDAYTNQYGLFIPRKLTHKLRRFDEWFEPLAIKCLKCGYVWELKNEREKKKIAN